MTRARQSAPPRIAGSSPSKSLRTGRARVRGEARVALPDRLGRGYQVAVGLGAFRVRRFGPQEVIRRPPAFMRSPQCDGP
jgi:hypothetical protein